MYRNYNWQVDYDDLRVLRNFCYQYKRMNKKVKDPATSKKDIMEYRARINVIEETARDIGGDECWAGLLRAVTQRKQYKEVKKQFKRLVTEEEYTDMYRHYFWLLNRRVNTTILRYYEPEV